MFGGILEAWRIFFYRVSADLLSGIPLFIIGHLVELEVLRKGSYAMGGN